MEHEWEGLLLHKLAVKVCDLVRDDGLYVTLHGGSLHVFGPIGHKVHKVAVITINKRQLKNAENAARRVRVAWAQYRIAGDGR